MKKKYVLIGLAVIIVGFGAALFGRTELFQGKFTIKRVPLDLIYSWYGQYASPVASPVPSVVVSEVSSDVPSEVVSEGGPSIVVSKVPSSVPSVVVSAVASPVVMSARAAAKVDPKEVKQLTAKVLADFAKKDFKKNPAKYTLSWSEKNKILKLYKMKK